MFLLVSPSQLISFFNSFKKKGDLVCNKRSAYEPVPGCSGEGSYGKDYCVKATTGGEITASPTSAPTKEPTTAATPVPTPKPVDGSGLPALDYLGENESPYGLCEGDCDRDGDCEVRNIKFAMDSFLFHKKL